MQSFDTANVRLTPHECSR